MGKDAAMELLKIEERIQAIVCRMMEIETLGFDSNFQDVNMESISFIKMLVNLEDEFGFEFDDEMLSIEKLPNIYTIANYIKSKDYK